METSHMVVYVDTPLQVLILPMRNGNTSTANSLQNQILVLILPMRNGNYSAFCKSITMHLARSYPTYEEWKHWKNLNNFSEQFLRVLILPMRNGN